MRNVRIGLAQINPTIADVDGNTDKIIHFLKEGRKDNVEVIAFPEMATIGYPAQDLLFRPEIIQSNLKALEKIAPYTKQYKVVAVGFCQPAYPISEWRIDRQHLYNACAIFRDGEYVDWIAKICLPNYGVFDDFRYFIPGKETKIFDFDGMKLGVEICEDLWYKNDENHPIYPYKPTKNLADQGAEFILVLNASPYHVGKEIIKDNLVSDQAKSNSVPICYVNMWGGNDKIIFDGYSIIGDKNGDIVARAKRFDDDLLIYDLDLDSKEGKPLAPVNYIEEESICQALVLAKRDYHRKCGIEKSIVGVSGGVDSAIVLALDVMALAKENVLAILSPARYSSKETLEDAIQLCKNFEVEYKIVPIEEQDENGYWVGVIPEKNKRYVKYFSEPENSVVFENQQAIDRMSILRSIANEDNRLVSGTGNKSELAVGYATVCGDLQADILVIGDLYKKQVFALARYINKLYDKEMIPNSIIERLPSAELAEDQVDPFDYQRLDELVKLKIEDYLSDEEILNYAPEGLTPFTEDEVAYYSRLIDINEHKRFKSGYIFKVSSVAFGEDRRINTAKRMTVLNK